jgi:hypothetical protein
MPNLLELQICYEPADCLVRKALGRAEHELRPQPQALRGSGSPAPLLHLLTFRVRHIQLYLPIGSSTAVYGTIQTVVW